MKRFVRRLGGILLILMLACAALVLAALFGDGGPDGLIARLLLKAPSVVVLDEATAHLDSESEVAVKNALRTALAGRTSLVIAHRLSTIREADQILVIEDGQIRERGQHEELLAAGGLYAELYLTQFASQEQQPAAVTAAGNGAGQPGAE